MLDFYDCENRCHGSGGAFQADRHQILHQLSIRALNNPIQYVFHEDTETCTPVYTVYAEDYEEFYRNAADDVENAKKSREYGLDMMNHPNWFDASYISWLSYDSLNIELPEGYMHFAPIINWGKYREENGRLMMPVSVRLNHAIADGFLVANVYRLLEKETAAFCGRH